MKRIAKTSLAALVAAALVSFVVSHETKTLKIGKKAPLTSQTMKGVDGKTHSLESLKKKNGLVVVFSCNTCPFVVGSKNFEGWEKEYNNLQKLANEKGVGFVLLNANEAKREGADSFEAMVKHAIDNDYKTPYLVDENSELADAFGAKTTPHVFLLDENFVLQFKGSIDNTWDTKRDKDENYLINALNEMNSGKIKVQESTPRGCSIKRIAPKGGKKCCDKGKKKKECK